MALAGGSSAALHNVLIGHGLGPCAKRIDKVMLCKSRPGHDEQVAVRYELFSFNCLQLKSSAERKNRLSWRVLAVL
jgi:hypothetical protein